MLFFKKNHGFSRRVNIFRRLWTNYSHWLPLIAVFSLGIFGSSIYYKNQPTSLNNQQASAHTTEVDKLTEQLLIEKDITDNLSDKNYELKQKLKKALTNASNKNTDTKLNKLDADLLKVTQTKDALTKENETLKKQFKEGLTQSKVKENKTTLEIKKNHQEEIQKLTQQLTEGKQLIENLNGTNTRLKSQLESALTKVKSQETNKNNEVEVSKNNRNSNQEISEISASHNKAENFNKVRIENSTVDVTQDKVNQLVNRNLTKNKPEARKTKAKKKESNNKKVRSMKLKKGESLWNLAKRAYGKGRYYKRIIKANPKITEKSFKSLRPGTSIFVPI